MAEMTLERALEVSRNPRSFEFWEVSDALRFLAENYGASIVAEISFGPGEDSITTRLAACPREGDFICLDSNDASRVVRTVTIGLDRVYVRVR